MAGTLYVVATPIGNLEDITFRAVRVLREVAVIAAEDTRRTARLLQHYSISTPTTSLHEHNERMRCTSLIARLRAGESVALVSDAGTPLISDPGALLVEAAHQANVRVEPIPGPSAALAAVSASGIQADQMLFVGFPPSRSSARKRWLGRLKDERRLIILYEAPHRIEATLTDIRDQLGERVIALGRELTKAHESLVVCQISEILHSLREPRGEYTVVIAPPPAQDGAAESVLDPGTLVAEFGELTNTWSGSRRDLVRKLALKYRLRPQAVYRLLDSGTK